MILRVSLLLLPVCAFAQQAAEVQAPPQAERDLRARVTAFYDNFLDKSFTPRKAEPFVAEDTKDFYYSAGKSRYQSYRIGKIAFSDNFTKAVVVVVGKMERLIAGQAVMMDVPQDTHWKIEDGEWRWTYHPEDYALTPMSTKNPPFASDGSVANAGSGVKPKNVTPEGVRNAGLSLLQQQPMKLEPELIKMNPDQAASAEVVFTNGADGDIQIALDGPTVQGLKVSLDKTTVPAHGTAVIALRYDPTASGDVKGAWQPKGVIPFRLIVAPFNRVFPLNLTFGTLK